VTVAARHRLEASKAEERRVADCRGVQWSGRSRTCRSRQTSRQATLRAGDPRIRGTAGVRVGGPVLAEKSI
jgi:hypothetical protein